MSDKCTCEHPVRDCIEAENCVGVQLFAELSSHDDELTKVKRQRDMLLEAAKPLLILLRVYSGNNDTMLFMVNEDSLTYGDLQNLRAAIAAVEGEK